MKNLPKRPRGKRGMSVLSELNFEIDATIPWQDTGGKMAAQKQQIVTKALEKNEVLNSEPKQSQNRAISEPKQSQNRAISEPKQSQNKAEHGGGISEFGARIGAVSEPIQSQIRANSEPGSEPKKDPADLSKLQMNCLQYVFSSARFIGGHVSERISSGTLAEVMKSTPSAVKKAMQRLESYKFIDREDFKKGPGGWSRYRLPETVYRELAVHEIRAGSEPFRSRIGAKTEPGTEPGTEPTLPSSSSLINNILMPTTEVADAPAREEHVWTPEDLDYSMLADIGLGRSQLLQLRDLGIDRATVQKSLIYFEFEYRYTESGKTIREPLALFMKRMRQNGCWQAPEEYQKRVEYFQTKFEERERELANTPTHSLLVAQQQSQQQDNSGLTYEAHQQQQAL